LFFKKISFKLLIHFIPKAIPGFITILPTLIHKPLAAAQTLGFGQFPVNFGYLTTHQIPNFATFRHLKILIPGILLILPVALLPQSLPLLFNLIVEFSELGVLLGTG
jgi:hypothetical protein